MSNKTQEAAHNKAYAFLYAKDEHVAPDELADLTSIIVEAHREGEQAAFEMAAHWIQEAIDDGRFIEPDELRAKAKERAKR